MESFSAQVDAWVLKTEKRINAVFKTAIQRVFEEARLPVGAGGNMPVVTGFLRASFLSTIGSPATVITFNTGSAGVIDSVDSQIALTILQAKIGDTVYGVFTAVYARRQEYEHYHFVSKAAQRWQTIVDDVVKEAKSRNP